MKHTDTEIEEATRRFETLADGLDPETANVEDLAEGRRHAGHQPQVVRPTRLAAHRSVTSWLMQATVGTTPRRGL